MSGLHLLCSFDQLFWISCVYGSCYELYLEFIHNIVPHFPEKCELNVFVEIELFEAHVACFHLSMSLYKLEQSWEEE
jgi:hypothetical protein